MDRERQNTIHYHFPLKDGLREVCKKFFFNTLESGQKVIYSILNKADIAEDFLRNDQQGKDMRTQMRSTEDRVHIREHIEKFPTLDSHYCRERTKRKYLESSLSIAKMYDLYREWCVEKYLTPAKEWLHQEVSNTECNLAFHNPKNDLCNFCEKFRVYHHLKKK